MESASSGGPDISVIVACLNGAETLEETLESLVLQRWDRPWEIVLADNGSTDASRAIFEDWAAHPPEIPMRVVDASAEKGKVYALNTAIRTTPSPAFLFIDADDTAAPGWLAAMGAALDRHPFVAARQEVEKLNPGWIAATRGHRLPNTELAALSSPPYCAVATGGALGFRREVFEAVGGFDPAFVAVEDFDFCIRAYLKGFELKLVPEAVYHYRYRSSPVAIYRQASSYAHHRALLRRRYGPDIPLLSPYRWAYCLGRLSRLMLLRLANALLRRRREPLDQALLSRRLGQAIGELSGALAFRVAPPGPRRLDGRQGQDKIAPDGCKSVRLSEGSMEASFGTETASRLGPTGFDISVIIACLNGAATLPETLAALTAQEWDRPWEIVFADNGSTDGSRAIFEAFAARHPGTPMRLIDVSARRGKVHALNAAVRASPSRAFLFCDADDVVAPGWLPAMGRALDAHPFVAARVDYGRLNPPWVLDYRAERVARAGAGPGDLLRLTYPPFCRYAGGGTFGFRREVFEAGGGFDPDFDHLEDIDFCIRAYRAGFEVEQVPEAVIHVRFRATPEAIRRQAYNYARSRALLRVRHGAAPAAASWAEWLALTGQALRATLSHPVKRLRRPGPLAEAKLNHRLGEARGDLAGALAFRRPARAAAKAGRDG